MDLALRVRTYCRRLLGFVAVAVHGNDPWTSGSTLLIGRVALLENDFPSSEPRELASDTLGVRRAGMVAGASSTFRHRSRQTTQALSA